MTSGLLSRSVEDYGLSRVSAVLVVGNAGGQPVLSSPDEVGDVVRLAPDENGAEVGNLVADSKLGRHTALFWC